MRERHYHTIQLTRHRAIPPSNYQITTPPPNHATNAPEKSGPRLAGVVGAACWGTGLATCGLAVETHSLPLLYAGYSALGGVAWGMLYLSPVDRCEIRD